MKILLGSFALLVLILSWICPSEQGPVINGAPIVANLHEETSVETKIICINCTNDDGLDIEVSDISITPYASFFDVYRLSGNDDFCVYYLPSQGSPDYKRVRAYNIQIQCSDTINSDTENVEIRIRTNEPPQILSSLSDTCQINARTTEAETKIHAEAILVNDTDNDLIIPTFTTDPASAAENYEIYKPMPDDEAYYIRSKNHLNVECNSDVTFYVYMSDGKNNPVGPVVMSCIVDNHYITPKIANIDKEIYVSEDTVLDTSLITFVTEPSDQSVTYDIQTDPASALSLFTVPANTHNLNLAGQLNYEDTLLRNINVSIMADNKYCPPEPQYLYIRVTDANDPPELGPKEVTKTVYEGKITVNPEFLLEDEDRDDSWTYSIIKGNDKGYFTIDPNTGVVSSTIDYDTDTYNGIKAMPSNQTLLIQVQDKKGDAVDNATMHLIIQDANDNPPEFGANSQQSETFTVSACDSPGDVLNTRRKLIAEDKIDTGYQNNNVTTIIPTSNQYLTVTQSGDIIHSGQIPAGVVSSLTVYAQDRGEYPGYLTSLNPVTITLVGTECPTTVVVTNSNSGSNSGNSDSSNINTVVQTVATVAPTTTTTTTAVPCTGFFCDAGNIALTVLGSLLGLLLLGLLGTLLYRYCCNKPVEPMKRTWTPPRKVRPVTPPTPPPKTPVTPRQITPKIQYVPTPVAVPVPPPPPPMVRVRRMVPVKQQQQMVKVKQMVAVPQQNVRVKQLVPVPGNATQTVQAAATTAAPK